jgi:Zn-finger nucleic acid-binding protein
MKCPQCTDTTLVMSDRQGVEIDYCPSCRGIWLDRGELDKLLDRASSASSPSTQQAPSVKMQHKKPDFVDSDYGSGQRYYGNRKKSWLSEIFD